MESEIKQYLKENNIIPFSVTYTKILGDLNTGLLCISFYNKEDYNNDWSDEIFFFFFFYFIIN